MKRFTGKTVVVTGGSRGLGAATAIKFANEGANIVINFINSTSEAETLADVLRKLGAEVISVRADVGNEDEVESLFSEVVDVFGKIDVLVNNAGIVFDIPFKEKSSKQWKRTMDVNLNGVYYCVKHVIPRMNSGGTIINIASTNGIDTYHPDSIDYDVTKAGVIMFTKAMARDLAPGIRINAIAPGWFDTDINKDLPKDYVKSESKKIAMGRFGKPEEIANVVAFLASEDASFMTGSIITVDGGYGGAV